MELKVGKKYVMRNCPDVKYVKIVRKVKGEDPYSMQGLIFYIDGNMALRTSYAVDGTFSELVPNHHKDLVAEYVEPKEERIAKLKRRIERYEKELAFLESKTPSFNIGSLWRARNDSVIQIVSGTSRSTPLYPITGIIIGDQSRHVYTFTNLGQYREGREHSLDLVEEVV